MAKLRSLRLMMPFAKSASRPSSREDQHSSSTFNMPYLQTSKEIWGPGERPANSSQTNGDGNTNSNGSDHVLTAEQYVGEYLIEEWHTRKDEFGNDRNQDVRIASAGLPSMDELWSYGEMGHDEGVRACARLFRAPGIWEEVGERLWERLCADLERRKQRQNEEEKEEESASKAVETPATPEKPQRGSRRRPSDTPPHYEPSVHFHRIDWTNQHSDDPSYASFWMKATRTWSKEVDGGSCSPKHTTSRHPSWSTDKEARCALKQTSETMHCRCCRRLHHFSSPPSTTGSLEHKEKKPRGSDTSLSSSLASIWSAGSRRSSEWITSSGATKRSPRRSQDKTNEPPKKKTARGQDGTPVASGRTSPEDEQGRPIKLLCDCCNIVHLVTEAPSSSDGSSKESC